jgi:hypothetical protein
MKRATALPTTAALLFFSVSSAQNPTSQVPKPVKPLNESTREAVDDWQKEQESRKFLLQKNSREHSDASGHVRADLWNEGVAHMKRMKVVSHMGPVSEAPTEKK